MVRQATGQQAADLKAADLQVADRQAAWEALLKVPVCRQAACLAVAVLAVLAVPVERTALTVEFRVADLAAALVVTGLVASGSFQATRIVPSNSVKSWTSPLAILTRRWVKNNARSHRSEEILKDSVTDPAVQAERSVWVNRQQARPAVVPVAAVQEVRVAQEARQAARKLRQVLSMA